MATNTEKIVVQVQVKGGKQLDNLTKKTGTATKSTGGLTKSMARMAGGVLAAAAAFRVIGQAVSGAIKTFTSFEFQMAKVKAISGASEKDFKKLSNTAQELGRTTFFTATQVAELQTNYAKLGFTTKEILNAQEATLLLATATGSDLGRAAIVAGAAVRGFGLDASETTRVVDVMTLSFNSSALDIEKWQPSMTKVAPIAAGMNIELEDTAAIMGTLTDAGIEASIAGTSMRNIFLKMKDSSSDLSKFLGFTVNSSVDLSKALEKLGTASDTTLDGLVNIRQVAAFSVMVKGAKRVEKLTEELRNAKGAAEEAANIIGDTLEGAFKRLTSATQGLAIKLTADLGGGLQDMVDGFANFINKLTDSSKGIANSIRFIVKLIKWVGAMALGIKLYTAAMLASAGATGVFQRALLLGRLAATKFTTAINFSRVAMKKFLIGSGIGIVVVLLTELAAAFMFSGDAAEDAADSNDTYTESLKKQMAREKELSKLNDKKLSKTIEQGEKDLEYQNQAIEGWKSAIAANKELLEQTTEGDKANIFFKDLILKQGEELLQMEKKKIKIELNNAQIRQNTLKLQLDNDIKAAEALNTNAILEEKRKYLANEISKKEFDDNIEALEIKHVANMIAVNEKHREGTEDLEGKLLDLKIKAHEQETDAIVKSTKVKIDNSIGTELQAEANRDYLDIMNLVLEGTITQKEAEEALRLEKIKAIEDALIAIPLGVMSVEQEAANYALRMSLEKQLIDLKLTGISDEVAARKQQIDGVAKLGDQIINLAGEDKKMQGIKKAGIALSSAAAIANNIQALSEMSLGVASQSKLLFPANIIGMVTTLSTIVSLFANIKSMKSAFGDGGVIETFANGGMVQGKSHAQGGEKFAVGGRVVELEGGESVINKRSTAMFSSQLSAMNAAGGGVKFADGGLLNQPSFSQQQFNALGQNQMMGAIGSSGKVVVVEADITESQNTVSVIQSQATI